MGIAYDPTKNERNIRERGLSFERAADFDFATATFLTEVRKGATRRVAVGYLEGRLHLLCYIPGADGIRVIAFARQTKGRQSSMANRKPLRSPLIDKDGEVREVIAEEVSLFKPFSALPREEQEMLLSLRRRGPQKSPRKVPISIRLSPEVVDGLRATGNGWQNRADEALRSWLAETGKARPSRAMQNR